MCAQESEPQLSPVTFVKQLRAVVKEHNNGNRFIELADFRKKRSIVLIDGEGADYRVLSKRQSWKQASDKQLGEAREFRIGGNDGSKLSITVDPNGKHAEVHYEELFGADAVGMSKVVPVSTSGVAAVHSIIGGVHTKFREKERALRDEFQTYAQEVFDVVGGQRLTIRRELYDERLGRATKRAVLYRPTKILFGPVLKSMFKIQVYGRDVIPRRSAAIIASNHISFSDCLFIPAAVDRRVTFVAKKELFEGQLKNMLFSNWGQIPIDRGSGDKHALRTALNVIKSGHLLGIFPEGTRSTIGKMLPAHTGVARLALKARVPVIPCGLLGCDQILPKGAHLPRIKPAVVSFGEPLLFTDYYGNQDDYESCREVTDQIITAILKQVEDARWEYEEGDKVESWTSISLPVPDDNLMLG